MGRKPLRKGFCRFKAWTARLCSNTSGLPTSSPATGEQALADARRIASYLVEQGASRVVGIGSAFEPSRPFTDRSDIDLVVEGIEPARFFAVSAGAAALTDFSLDLTPLEAATPALRRFVGEEGVEL